MAFETININYSTDLGINYIPCCKVVLMLYNVCIRIVADRNVKTLSKEMNLINTK